MVEEVYSCLSHKRYARKTVVRSRTNGPAQKDLVKELDALKSLSHRHLVKVLGSYTGTYHIAYLMLPVAQGNLDDLLQKPGGLTDGDKHDIRSFFGCLAGAANYLHRSRIRHRDLSLKNILVSDGSVFISDFGSAYKWAGTNNQGSVTQHHNVPATRFYMAPEVAKNSARNSSSDMWSLGIIFLEMTTLLVGRTLTQLRSKLSDNRQQNIEPYFWANPRVVTDWLQILQEANQGPAHDNEPLEWIRDLLHITPKSRPTSGALMESIHDTQSFHIFCCIDCQSEFRERRFKDNDLQIVEEEASGNATDIMQNVACILEEAQQPVLMSSRTQSTIQSWLANTEVPIITAPNIRAPDIVVRDHMLPSRMPGEFDTDDDGEDIDLTESEPGSSVGNTTHSLAIDSDNAQDFPAIEAPSMDEKYRSSPHSHLSQLQKFSLPVTLEHVKDTGLGIFEIDSPSSSDDGIREVSDSSGSDAGSDGTIKQPLRAGDAFGRYNEESRCSVLERPHFVGDVDKPLQVLDSLDPILEVSDGSDDDDMETTTETDQIQTVSPKSTFESTATPGNDVRVEAKHSVHLEAAITTPNKAAKATDAVNQNLEDGDMQVNLNITEVNMAGAEAASTNIFYGEECEQGTQPIKISAMNRNTTNTSGDNMPLAASEEDLMSEMPSEHPNIRHVKNTRKKRSALAAHKRQDSVVSCSEDQEDTEPSPPTGAGSTLLTTIAPRNQERSTSQGEAVGRLTEVPVDVQTPLDEVKSRRKKKSPLHVTFVEEAPESPETPVKEEQSLSLGIDPSDYIQNTWETASSVATSVMSATTKRMMQGFSLPRWWDHDHNLLEVFCSQGKAQAVRALLEKGCNPGRAGPKGKRRSGPITLAIKGASPRHNKCVIALIQAEADVNVVNHSSGKTPLHLAIENPRFRGYEHLICSLIDAGANPNHADIRGDRPITKILLESGNGPLEEHRQKALALLLRDNATDVEVTQPGTLNTALHLAVRRKDPVAVAMLLFKKANINAKNAAGSTPLLVAANQLHNPTTKDQKLLMSILLHAKAILVNEKAGVKEQTALHYAVNAGVFWAVEMMLERSADPTCEDKEGRNALTLAQACAEDDNWSPEDRNGILSRLQQASVKDKMLKEKHVDVVSQKLPKKKSARGSKPASSSASSSR
jgi:serine/threonine protein kinase/ankyrin repeat protein